MPVSPNDPDYGEIMRQHREEAGKVRKEKKKNRLYIPPGYSQSDPAYKEKREKERLRSEKNRQKRKEQGKK